MKKKAGITLILFFIGLGLYIERYAFMILMNEKTINGTKILSLHVDGDVMGNGYRFYSIYKPMLLYGDAPNWNVCSLPKEKFLRFVFNISKQQHQLKNNFLWMSEQENSQVKIFIKTKAGVLQIIGLEDYGGTLSLSSNDICYE